MERASWNPFQWENNSFIWSWELSPGDEREQKDSTAVARDQVRE
jgi:hypothetical protein